MTAASVVWSLMAPFATMALGTAPQVDAPDLSPPTAIENALTERACSRVASGGTFETDPHAQCLAAVLASLRADFGRDLRRLSGPERNMLDTTCSRLQSTHGQEAYLDCIIGQMTALRARRNRGKSAAAEPALAATLVAIAPSPEAPSAQQASSRTGLIVAGALVTVVAIAAGALLVTKSRRARRTCRECSAVIPDSGDLCSTCRHAAAEVIRRASTERLEQERASDALERKLRAQEAEHRRKTAQQEEDARLRALEDARQRDEDNTRRREAEDALRRGQTTAVSEPVAEEFDPYAVLGVPRDTTQERIRAAYEEARTRYDRENVAHLGVDIQEHYQLKAQAVDRAYQMLAG